MLSHKGKTELCISLCNKSYSAMCFVSNENLYESCVCNISKPVCSLKCLHFRHRFKLLIKVLGFSFLVLLTWIYQCETSKNRFNNIMKNARAFATNAIQSISATTLNDLLKVWVFSNNGIPIEIWEHHWTGYGTKCNAKISSSSSSHLSSSHLFCSRRSDFI